MAYKSKNVVKKQKVNVPSAPSGNDYAVKFVTPEERQALCKAWCDHIRHGYSKESFPLCSYKTLEHYAKKFPSDFPSDIREQAYREGMLKWEKIGMGGTSGKLRGFNAMSYKFIIQNKYGWKDKQEMSSDPNNPLPAPTAVVILPDNGRSYRNK